MQRLRQQRDVDRRVRDRQPLELAALPGDVADLAARRELACRARARPRDRSTAIDAPRPARGLDRQIALAAAEIGDVDGRQQQAERARPRRPAPARHELTALVAGAVLREVLLAAAAALPPAAHRRRASPASRARTRRAARPTAAPARCDLGLELGDRRYQVNVPARSSATRPASRSRPRCRDTPDWATPRIAVSSETFSASRDSTPQQPQPGLVAEQPQEAGRVVHIYKSTYIDV